QEWHGKGEWEALPSTVEAFENLKQFIRLKMFIKAHSERAENESGVPQLGLPSCPRCGPTVCDDYPACLADKPHAATQPDAPTRTPVMDAFADSCVTNQLLIYKKSDGRNEKANLQEMEWLLAVEQGRQLERALAAKEAELVRLRLPPEDTMSEHPGCVYCME